MNDSVYNIWNIRVLEVIFGTKNRTETWPAHALEWYKKHALSYSILSKEFYDELANNDLTDKQDFKLVK